MKPGLTIAALAAAFAATLALPAVAQDFQYTLNTNHLPDSELVAADVVRQPAFTGEKDEKVQAMDQATTRLNADYCSKRTGSFVVDNGIVLFDDIMGAWMVGGVCR